MDRIAWILGNTNIYWSAIILTLAVGAAICFFLSRYLKLGEPVEAGLAAVPLSIVLSVLLSRLVHWYCRTDSYESLWAAVTYWSSGGFALVGTFAGCFLAALLLRLRKLHRNLPRMLDCMSIAGAAGIALGRLAAFFNTTDRGQILQKLTFLPFAYPVTNNVSGAQEYRLATFLFQAAVALAIFLWLCLSDRKERRDGDVTLRFILVYGASQVVLDSTRYDKLFFRSNGFVSIVQVLGGLAMAVTIGVFAVRLVKKRGLKARWVAMWLAIAGAIGGAGFMEYFVQRHGNLAVLAYSVMSVCLVCVSGLTLAMGHLAEKNESEVFSR